MAYQHAAHSVLRAVETRRPCCAAARRLSGWIDELACPRRAHRRPRHVYFRGVKTLPVKRDARWIGRASFYVEHGTGLWRVRGTGWFGFLSA